MFKFRALTYHAPPPSGSLEEYVHRLKFDELRKYAKALSSKREVWSTRVVAPPLEEAASSFETSEWNFAETFYEEASRTADYVAFPLNTVDSAKIVELAYSFERAYFSVVYASDYADRIIRVLRDLPEKAGWEAGSRFAVSFGKRVVTPYFPATTSEEEGFTLSLLYPLYVKRKLEEGCTLAEALRDAALTAYRDAYAALDASGVNVPLLGVDLSLSPWRDESVATLVETILGMPFGNPGTLSAVKAVNEALSLLASSLKTTGYNEVMLPLAEDNRLKELASMGQLKFRDLLYLTLACVTGLDMIPLPATTEDRLLEWLMRDLDSARRIKARPLGMRLLLVDVEPGEEVELGMFGKTPVLDVLD